MQPSPRSTTHPTQGGHLPKPEFKQGNQLKPLAGNIIFTEIMYLTVVIQQDELLKETACGIQRLTGFDFC